MSVNPNEQEETELKSANASVLRLVSGVKKLAENDKLSSWLNKHTLVVNLIFVGLMSYGGYNVLDGFVLEAIGKESFEHHRITKDNMDSVCENEEFYSSKLRGQYDPEKDKVESLGAKYVEKKTQVYPVFRWACEYEITRAKINSSEDLEEAQEPSGGGASEDYKYTGIALDEYFCQVEFKRYTKATYLDFEDPYSWYCANTDAGF